MRRTFSARIPRAKPGHARDAFTLLELLLVIAIIAILISMAIPALGDTRDRALELTNQSEIASHAKVMSIYLADNRDAYPALVPVGATSSTYIVAGQPYTINGYFGQVYAWPFGLAERYYDGQVTGDLFQRPRREPWLVTDYRYSASFMADPAFWNYASRTGPEQWRGQHSHSVRYPSAKVLLADDRIMDGIATQETTGVIALTDASARLIARDKLSAPFPPGEGEWPGSWSTGRPGIHTIDGVFGRDIQP